ncbi:hypothetical protein H5P28_06565 [Ruficoccus amylovorans]|uniref:TonB C-terminal domain-containing protein n=1 Tax=Ruficoccus amylovorans TaxID=1804625 RepID=A0A842HF34_9BACT|nr:hypothetical protein [Ruficoccus amylovorans]MBC2593921.1 hypothetical protein [Ruficoccus amylovorans]
MTTAPLPPPRRKPSEWPRWDRESDFDRRAYRTSVTVGLAVTVIFHLMLIYVVPWPDVNFEEAQPEPPNPPMEVELVEAPPEPERFVETNPNVIEEKPKDTQNYAAQDQVAAQEQPDTTQDSEIPKIDGEIPDSQKIVTGDLSEESSPPPVPVGLPDAQPAQQQPDQQAQPTEQAQEQVETPTPEPQEQAQPVEQPAESEATETPQQEAPKMPEQEAVEDEGTPSIEKAGEAEKVAEKPEEKTVEPAPSPRPQREISVMMEEVAPSQQAQQGELTPRPRPRINFKVPPGPLMQNPVSASRMGALAIDANFSEFGAYQQRMMEAISAQWNLLGRQFNYASADYGTKVVTEYKLNRDGQVSDLKVIFSSASRPATLLVQDAILSRAPFGAWTKEMVAMLGEDQTIRITFFYR